MLEEVVSNINEAVAAIIIIIGALNCFLGLKLFKIWQAILCLASGFIIGAGIGLGLFNSGGMGIMLGVALAILLAYLSWKIYKFGVFMTVFGFSAVAMAVVSIFLMDGSEGSLIFGLIISIVVGFIGMSFARLLIIGFSAFSGGPTMASGIMIMAGSDSMGVYILLSAVLIALGAYVQWKTNPEQKEKPTEQPQFQPTMAQPQPTMAQPQPTMAQPQPMMAQPQPTMAQTQPTMAQPQPMMAQTQPTMAQPQQPTMAQTQSTMAQTQPQPHYQEPIGNSKTALDITE